MEKNIEELTLLLMYLTSWEDEPNPFEDRFKQCWKGYSFDVINELTDKGYLFPSKYKNKSVTLTKEGEKLAKELIEKYLGRRVVLTGIKNIKYLSVIIPSDDEILDIVFQKISIDEMGVKGVVCIM